MEAKLVEFGRRSLEQVLVGETGLDLVAGGVGFPETGRTPDAVWVLRSGSEEWCFLVEVKSTLWPSGVAAMAAQAKALAAETDADRCLVIVPRVTDRTAEFLRREGIDYIDLCGNIRVSVPGRILVMVRGGRESTVDDFPLPKDRIANPFAGKASRIVRALLAEPRRWWGVTELAERVEVTGDGAIACDR